jgi:2-polyprenyl-6-methoxyphenol hydroxylase-like FAD-dependent oxidoreductase
MITNDNPIVIAGAGPTGLLLATELALAGVRPLVLECLPEPSTEARANGLTGQVVRMLDRRGLYDRLAPQPGPPTPSPGYMFGALPLYLNDLPDNPMYILPAPQTKITRMLAERADELGVEVRYGHAISGLEQDHDRVKITIAGPNGAYELQTRYLVGADGGHSTTRKLIGIDFPGVTRSDVVSRSAHALPPAEWIDPRTGGLDVPGHGLVPRTMHHRTERGVFVYGVLPGRPPLITTLEWDTDIDDELPMTLQELEESTRRVLGVEVPLTLPATGDGPHMLRRRVSGNTRLADHYRNGRVFLVGDAAHVHSAIGGPGLNLGMQDAINLGWRLAAEINGVAAPGLLDGYEAERRPVARRVILSTEAQSALIAPGPEVTWLRELFGELMQVPATRQHLVDLLSGAEIHYDMGISGHALIGRWAPDVDVRIEGKITTLAALTLHAKPLLLDLTNDGSPSQALGDHADVINIVRAEPVSEVGATAILLRPDCYVAWATAADRPEETELDGLRAAFGRWYR